MLAGKVAYTIFSPEHHRPYTYLLFVVPILIALRNGILGAAAAATVMTPIVLVLTGEGGGPYGLLPLESALHQVQFFAAVLAAVLLLAGATADALRRTGLDAALRLRQAVDVRRRFERIATSIDEGVFTYRRLPTQWVLDYASPAWGEIFGLEITPTAGDLLEEYIHPDDIEGARAGWDRVDAGSGSSRSTASPRRPASCAGSASGCGCASTRAASGSTASSPTSPCAAAPSSAGRRSSPA